MPFLFLPPHTPFFFLPPTDFINPACVTTTVPPCQQVSRKTGWGGALKWAFFLTRTWQMSSQRVWAPAGSDDELRLRVGVTKTEGTTNKTLFSSFLPWCFQAKGFSLFAFCFFPSFKPGFRSSGPSSSQRLCKNSPSAVVIDAAALWRQLGQAGSLQPRLPLALSFSLLRLPRLPEGSRKRPSPVWMCSSFFLAGRKLSRSGLQGS